MQGRRGSQGLCDEKQVHVVTPTNEVDGVYVFYLDGYVCVCLYSDYSESYKWNFTKLDVNDHHQNIFL